MDIGHDHDSLLANRPDGEGKKGTPEWHVLLTRLSTARSVSITLVEQSAAIDAMNAGSFDCGSARALADFGQSLPSVNPVFWANGKPSRNMDALVAGSNTPGDRG